MSVKEIKYIRIEKMHNEEIKNFHFSPNTARLVESRRMNWMKQVLLIVCGLFTDAIRSSDYIASNDR
jgi:hypothetical protein